MSSCTDLLVVSWWIILSPPKRRSVGWGVQIGPWPRAHTGQLGRGFSKKGMGELGSRVTHTLLFHGGLPSTCLGAYGACLIHCCALDLESKLLLFLFPVSLMLGEYEIMYKHINIYRH